MTTQITDSEATAEARVNASETLSAYRDLLLEYDWSNRDEHLAWVASAPESEIVFWAEQIRRDERDEAPIEQVSTLTMIRPYTAPQWLVEPLAECDAAEVEAVQAAGFEVLDRDILGWGEHNAIIRSGDCFYLATLAA
jgi:hypothetical protein